MASSVEFVQYVCEKLEGLGEIRSKKMFGEYLVYINDKPVVMVCDNIVYIKMLKGLENLLADGQTGTPYEGAKPHYMVNPDDTELLRAAVGQALPIIPVPAKRKKKTS